ncbi:hypothetical protein OAK51_02965 [Alphaproteobacteria bacterium]|nr:hypothetical protein [Alphaproteobacteria bacterium]
MIPTTNNLVGISDITYEDPLVSSVICENNNLEALPISHQYNSFVQSPTGIIEKITGHSSYRIDITGRIEQGDSWQLGIAIAHIFHKKKIINFSKNQNLISNDEDTIIWASGIINSNLDIKKIDYLEKKIENSVDFFKECLKNDILVKIILSDENIDDFHKIVFKKKFLKEAIAKKQISLMHIKNLNNFFNNLDLKNFLKVKKPLSSLFTEIKKYLRSIVFITLALIIFFSSFNIWQAIKPLLLLKENDKYRVLLTNLSSYRQGNLSERVSAYFFDYFQSLEAKKLNKQIVLNFLPYSNQEELKKKCLKVENSFNIVCNLNVEVTNVGKDKIFLWILKMTESDIQISNLRKQEKINPEIINGLIQSKETISIDIKKAQDPTTLFFVYGKRFDNKVRDWLVNLSKRNSLLKLTVRRIKSLGYGYMLKKINSVRIVKDIL